ncbi:hypothetical protein [Stutzerimonas stutzeri]|uniref:hypothetical protein n=1 Tax=Stutzerimonas stutzeri TaxID=316 RepID=UPI003314A069
MPRFNEQDYKRLNLFISNEMFAEFQELNVGKSIPAICVRLLKSHLLDLQLKAEFARLNALGGGGDIPESLNGHG